MWRALSLFPGREAVHRGCRLEPATRRSEYRRTGATETRAFLVVRAMCRNHDAGSGTRQYSSRDSCGLRRSSVYKGALAPSASWSCAGPGIPALKMPAMPGPFGSSIEARKVVAACVHVSRSCSSATAPQPVLLSVTICAIQDFECLLRMTREARLCAPTRNRLMAF